LLQTLFGVHRMEGGEISLNGMVLKMRSPRNAMSAGIAYVPEDRKLYGLALNLGIAENFALPNLRRLGSFGILRKRKRDQLATLYAERLNLRYRKLSQLALLLSGGNQQKIVVGKWLARTPLVLLLDEPTRGIDVGAKAEIYALIRELTEEGMSILLVSSELTELLALSHRIIVMREGQLSGELAGDGMNEESIVQLATPGLSQTP
jgi:ABC-type sugar transport system ATPase subunit